MLKSVIKLKVYTPQDEEPNQLFGWSLSTFRSALIVGSPG